MYIRTNTYAHNRKYTLSVRTAQAKKHRNTLDLYTQGFIALSYHLLKSFLQNAINCESDRHPASPTVKRADKQTEGQTEWQTDKYVDRQIGT